MDIELTPPALASRHSPIKLTGPGTLAVESTGLRVRAASSQINFQGIGLLLGGIAVFIACLAATIAWTLPKEITIGVGLITAIFVIARAVTLKRTPTGEPETVLFPWENVKNIYWDMQSKSLVVVVKKMKPKGGLYIAAGPHSELERDLGKAHRAFLLAEQKRGN